MSKKSFDHLGQPQLILESSKDWPKIVPILLRFCISAAELSIGPANIFLDFSDIVVNHEVQLLDKPKKSPSGYVKK